MTFPILNIALAGFAGFLLGYLLRRYVAEARIKSAEEAARRIIEEAGKEAEAKKREAIVEAKDESFRQKREAEREIREQRAEMQRLERRLEQREESLDRKTEALENRERTLTEKEQELARARDEAQAQQARHQQELERVSGLTAEQAREQLLRQVEAQARADGLKLVKKIETEAREDADRRAREIIALAIQRCAADHTAEVTVSVVPLPNDDMKGRIIGREGRNIRTLEGLTGVDFIIDDTPEAVTLSSFDPIRREIAKIALEKLIVDGRIHPARIEERVEKPQRELGQRIREEGERAAFEAGGHGLHPEVLNAITYHHGEEEAKCIEAILVAAADAISASRPGARKETAEMYIKRLEGLERIATSFPGVEKAYAIQAGREVRVLVRPTDIDDLAAQALARDVAKKIEDEMEYPGQIKVTVLRETRVVEYAR